MPVSGVSHSDGLLVRQADLADRVSQPDSLPLAARCRRLLLGASKSSFDQIPMSDKKRACTTATCTDTSFCSITEMQSDNKTKFRVRLHHVANEYVLKREKMETYTWSHPDQNQRNPNAPSFEERSIEWTLNMKEKTRTSAWILHINVCIIPGSHSENRRRFFKPSPASNVSSPSFGSSKEREVIVDSGASLHMMRKN